MPRSDFQPISNNQRIPLIDVLRGWALLGVVLMNYIDFYFLAPDSSVKTSKATDLLLVACSLVFSSKSWTLLSFLFGYGFSVIMQSSRLKNINSYSFFVKRMLWLFVFAFINCVFYFGDILKDYAFLGLILLLFNRCSAKASLYFSAALFVVIPLVTAWIIHITGTELWGIFTPYLHLYKSSNLLNVFWFNLQGTWFGQVINLNCAVTVHTVMFCCFLLGQAAQKASFFTRTDLKQKMTHIWAISLLCLIIVYLLTYLVNKPALLKPYFNADYWTVLITMVFISSSICWLYLSGKWQGIFTHLQYMGKMTLTNYITQNIIGVFLFSGAGLGWAVMHKLPVACYYLLGLVIYIVQLYFSKWWLGRYNYGPIEWLWRQLSYGKRLTIKK
ncbi:DUF418 domain-containing protein [Inquilinus sp. KBS0705]|nr:DUF418 domain-containing protein [Inquilinus sp. KBS0705]